jgi:hypothetical protein
MLRNKIEKKNKLKNNIKINSIFVRYSTIKIHLSQYFNNNNNNNNNN